MNYTLITGATGGLGTAFVFELLKQNENLILTSTKQEKLDALLKTIANKDNILTFVCNLSKKQDRQNLLKFIKEQKITITRLINNAGVIIEGDMEKFDDEIEIYKQGDVIINSFKKFIKTKKFSILL